MINLIILTIYKIIETLILLAFYWIESVVYFIVPRRWRFKRIDNEIVLITGGASGLGRSLALKLSRLCKTIIILDVNDKLINETIKLSKKSGANIIGYKVDVSDRHQVYQIANKIKSEIGDVTILINNAGIVNGKEFLTLDDEQIIKLMQINTMAHFWTLKSFLPQMIAKNHGHIVTISSACGCCGLPKLTDYCTSKFAVVGLEESLRFELQAKNCHGVHSTVVCPAFINTGLFDGYKSLIPPLETDHVADGIISGISTNQTIVVLPKSLYFMFALKSFLPVKCSTLIIDALGGMKSMEEFRGKKHE